MVNLAVPIALTRQSMYYSTILFSTFVILLPFSILSYLYFYSTLIPILVLRVPITFFPRDSFHQERRGYANLEPYTKVFEQTPELVYLLSLNLDIICYSEKNSIRSVIHNVTLGSYSARSTFVLNCEEDYIFHSNNRLVPYKLRHYVPPQLTDIRKIVTVNSPYSLLSGRQISQSLSHNARIDVHKNTDVDDNHSFLEFYVQWDGIRYYMVTYYKTSLLVGTIIFWGFSSFVCLLTAMVTWSKYNESDQEVKNIKVKKES
jgi:hypothetical protein